MVRTESASVNPDARPATQNKQIPLSARLSGVMPKLSLDRLAIICSDGERESLDAWLAACPVELTLSIVPKHAHASFVTASYLAESQARRAAMKAALYSAERGEVAE